MIWRYSSTAEEQQTDRRHNGFIRLIRQKDALPERAGWPAS